MDQRNRQIREDWRSGLWTVEELSCFWGLDPRQIAEIVIREVRPRAGDPQLQHAS